MQVKEPYEPLERIANLVCVDSLNCYAFGDPDFNTVVYKSTNSGKTWEEIGFIEGILVDGDNCELLHGRVFSNNSIFAICRNGIALEVSTDNGKTFRSQDFPDLQLGAEYLRDVRMYDSLVGAGITYTKLITTKDNWFTYDYIETPDSLLLTAPIFFIDSTNIAVQRFGDYNPSFYKYNMKTQEWSEYSRSSIYVPEEERKRISDLVFVNDTLGFACGFHDTGEADKAKDVIWKTTDNGIHWKLLMSKENYPPFGLLDIDFRNENYGVAVGDWGKVLETTDGGENWNLIPSEDEIITFSTRCALTGEYIILSGPGIGIFRLEITTNIKVIRATENIRVRQADNTLQIAINDETHSEYKLNILDATGTIHQSESIASGVGFLYYDVSLDGLSTGVYFYSLDGNHGIVSTGKFIIMR